MCDKKESLLEVYDGIAVLPSSVLSVYVNKIKWKKKWQVMIETSTSRFGTHTFKNREMAIFFLKDILSLLHKQQD